jgi:type I restriction enzyme, R subunit
MPTNFSFLQLEFEHLQATAQDAETQVYAAPMYCSILCRKSLEEMLRWLYDNDKDI